MKPFLSSRAKIPARLLTAADIQKAKKLLYFEGWTINDDPETVNEFKQKYGVISVPRAWALKNWKHINFVDKTTFPISKVDYPKSIIPRNDKQRDFFETIVKKCKVGGPVHLSAKAKTGSGKSVAAIWTGMHLKTRVLILVDSNKIKNQWKKLFTKLFNQRWTNYHVGVVQQDLEVFKNKTYVIAMVQSLISRKYSKEFYKHFGLVVYDEAQIFGTRTGSRVLSMFSARCLIGLTATPKEGGFGRLVRAHLGPVVVESSQPVMKPLIFIKQRKLNNLLYGDNDFTILTSLSRNAKRNADIAFIIDKWGLGKNRTVLVLSDRVKQLQDIKRILRKSGVAINKIGLHVAEYETGRTEICINCKNGKKKIIGVFSKRNEASGIVKELRYELSKMRTNDTKILDISNELVSAKKIIIDYIKKYGIDHIEFSLRNEICKPTHNELDRITDSCDIILATYRIFAKAVDVPRIDMGIEATPIGSITQPLGRVLRIMPGKPQPVWICFNDVVSIKNPSIKEIRQINIVNDFFERKMKTRMRHLEKIDAEVKRI